MCVCEECVESGWVTEKLREGRRKGVTRERVCV